MLIFDICIAMKKVLLLSFIIFSASGIFAQKIDSIYFHLYTDSLKKGTHNYINVDGKMDNGRWMPLTDKHIQFSCSYGSFSGNELVLPWEPTQEKVTIKAILKSNTLIQIEKTIWIKKTPDGPLPIKNNVAIADTATKKAKSKKSRKKTS
jgi:hypothetical protein